MRKFLLSLVCLFALTAYSADTYTHTFTSSEGFTTEGGTITLSDFNWVATGCDFIGFDNNGRGVQIGSGNKPALSYSISSTDFSAFTIKSVTINSSTASKSDATMTIKVGDKESEAYTLKSSEADYKFECEDAKGDIVISWSQETKKALYLLSITVEYVMPADMVTVPTPTFNVESGIFADQVKVSVETTNQEAKIYYTLDGTTPSYEDYKAEIGSTKRSSYYVREFTLTETTTIKAIAVLEGDEISYSSKVAEATYTIYPGVAYVPASEIVSGSRYAFIVEDGIANPDAENSKYSYLNVTDITNVGNYVKDIERNSFTFTATEGGFTIQDNFGRYLYKNEDNFKNFNFAEELPEKGGVWSVTFADGTAKIVNVLTSKTVYYSKEYTSFGCYAETDVKEDMTLPTVYVKRDVPTATITPAAKSTLDKFQTITITCANGLKVSDNFKAVATNGMPASYGGWKYDMTITQENDNTITLSTAEPITGNMTFWVQITGKIYMDPEILNIPMEIPSVGIEYTTKEEVPAATIDKISPENNSVVESLSYIKFTFSYYAGASEDETLLPKLYKEGDSDNLIAVEYTTMTEDGNGHIDMMDGALKVTEPITTNGTYILEIPTGYFIDGYGNNIEGVTLKYTVQNDGTGIEDVVTENANSWVVYNVLGVKVMETTDATELNTLAKGLYIINGVKTIVK